MEIKTALVACEESQEVTAALIAQGIDAVSCDLNYPGAKGLPHRQCDIREVLYEKDWDLLIAFPPCDRLANSGVRWLEERNLWDELDEACEFFKLFIDHPCKYKRIENPIPHKHALQRIGRKYDQIVQPWWFGHQNMKATCFWNFGLPPLFPTNIVGPPPKDYKERLKWQTIWMASPGPDRKKFRSKTFPGIAQAIATQIPHPTEP